LKIKQRKFAGGYDLYNILACTTLKILMRFVRPKIIGTLKVQEMMSGTLAVMNDIKNPPNKIIVPCESKEHGEEIIKRIKDAKFGDVLHL
jgi:hypothetical protein